MALIPSLIRFQMPCIDLEPLYDFGFYSSRVKAEFGVNTRSNLTEQYFKDNLFLYVVIYRTFRPLIMLLMCKYWKPVKVNFVIYGCLTLAENVVKSQRRLRMAQFLFLGLLLIKKSRVSFS